MESHRPTIDRHQRSSQPNQFNQSLQSNQTLPALQPVQQPNQQRLQFVQPCPGQDHDGRDQSIQLPKLRRQSDLLQQPTQPKQSLQLKRKQPPQEQLDRPTDLQGSIGHPDLRSNQSRQSHEEHSKPEALRTSFFHPKQLQQLEPKPKIRPVESPKPHINSRLVPKATVRKPPEGSRDIAALTAQSKAHSVDDGELADSKESRSLSKAAVHASPEPLEDLLKRFPHLHSSLQADADRLQSLDEEVAAFQPMQPLLLSETCLPKLLQVSSSPAPSRSSSTQGDRFDSLIREVDALEIPLAIQRLVDSSPISITKGTASKDMMELDVLRQQSKQDATVQTVEPPTRMIDRSVQVSDLDSSGAHGSASVSIDRSA